MKYITDLHIHSKYSRACSKNLDLVHIAAWQRLKGIHVVSCADFTHPKWFHELKEKLEEKKPGLYGLKDVYQKESDDILRELCPSFSTSVPSYVILGTEISCIYTKNGKCRRIHLLVFAPTPEVVEKTNTTLARIGNIASDGRPILGCDVKDVMKIALAASEECFFIPAHMWTPWFSLFGSKSGFNSIKECFEELSPYIFAGETGLSSDPYMNWQWSELDAITLVSNSDAHSLEKLGREANIFIGEDISYENIREALKAGKKGIQNFRLDATIEFFPEEGKYHCDGHRACKFVCSPAETKKLKGICPMCKKSLTIGVLNRVMELADQDAKEKIDQRIRYKSIIPLQEIIAQGFGVGVHSKKVQELYFQVINRLGSEFEILLDTSFQDLKKNFPEEIFFGIKNMREGRVELRAGYDGEFGVIRVCAPQKKMQPELAFYDPNSVCK